MTRRTGIGSFAVVQRHADERTQVAGLETIAREFPGAAIAAVAAGSFPLTLRRCFEAAVELDREWTVTVDGDVLLLPGAGRAIMTLADRAPSTVGHVGLLVHDRVTREIRAAGVRLYRTATMQAALERGDWGGTLRPETELLASLDDVVAWAPSVLVGLHDHEQYLRDLFRTAFVMVRKKAHQRDRLIALWRGRPDDPADMALVAGALAAGRPELELTFAASDYRALSDAFLLAAGLEERAPLTEAPSPDLLEQLVPAHAQRLRRPGLAARRLPKVWKKAGNGVHGLALLRYALGRTIAVTLRR